MANFTEDVTAVNREVGWSLILRHYLRHYVIMLLECTNTETYKLVALHEYGRLYTTEPSLLVAHFYRHSIEPIPPLCRTPLWMNSNNLQQLREKKQPRIIIGP